MVVSDEDGKLYPKKMYGGKRSKKNLKRRRSCKTRSFRVKKYYKK